MDLAHAPTTEQRDDAVAAGDDGTRLEPMPQNRRRRACRRGSRMVATSPSMAARVRVVVRGGHLAESRSMVYTTGGMRLLISVRGADEAAAALAGGADIVDAKDPAAGALGPVSPEVLRQIVAAVAGRRMVSAALGDAADERAVAHAAAVAASSGAALVKVGLAGIGSVTRAARLLAAAAGASGAGTVAVAYADHAAAGSLAPEAVVDAAARAGAAGLLVDTADKRGPGLRGLVERPVLSLWIEAAHTAGLLVALAGQLEVEDVPWLQGLGADVVGVRGAACDGGRDGAVSAARVRVLAGVLPSAASA